MDAALWVAAVLILVFGLVVVRGAPYVPSHRKYARKSLTKLYAVGSKDTLVDLGSGDGVILRLAAEKGARAIGYELNPILVGISKLLSLHDKKVSVRTADYWRIELPKDTTIVYIFAVSRDAKKLERKMQEWTDKKGDDLLLMTYGTKLKTKQPVGELDAHTLYRFTPSALQRP